MIITSYPATLGSLNYSAGNILVKLQGDMTINGTLNIDSGDTVKVISIDTVDGVPWTLNGNNSRPIFNIAAGGTLFLENVKITGGNATNGGGICNAGTLVMLPGTEISGNTGVGVYNSGTMYMEGGIISGNTAAFIGGGVYCYSGTFTMYGGTISNNTVTAGDNGYGNNGGVYNDQNTFTMYDGNRLNAVHFGHVHIGERQRGSRRFRKHADPAFVHRQNGDTAKIYV